MSDGLCPPPETRTTLQSSLKYGYTLDIVDVALLRRRHSLMLPAGPARFSTLVQKDGQQRRASVVDLPRLGWRSIFEFYHEAVVKLRLE